MRVVVIELVGSDTAVHHPTGVSYTAAGNKHDPVPPLLRQLVAEGYVDQEDTVEVVRGTALCFKPCSVGRWAAIDISDESEGGLRVRKAYVGPHAPGSTGISLRLGVVGRAYGGEEASRGTAAPANILPAHGGATP